MNADTANTNELVLTEAVGSLAAAAEHLSTVGRMSNSLSKRFGPRRGLSREEAAGYVGVGSSTFDKMVTAKSMPKPINIGARRVWDVRALDAAFDALSNSEDDNPWDSWR